MGKCPCSASSPLRHLLLCSQVQLVLILWQLHLLVTICCHLCIQPLCTLLKKKKTNENPLWQSWKKWCETTNLSWAVVWGLSSLQHAARVLWVRSAPGDLTTCVSRSVGSWETATFLQGLLCCGSGYFGLAHLRKWMASHLWFCYWML